MPIFSQVVDENVNDFVIDHHSTEGTEDTEDTIEFNESAAKSVIPENNEEIETTHADQRLWVKPPVELFTEQIKEEVQECEYESVLDIKDEVEESEKNEDDEMQEEAIIRCEPEPIEPPVEIQLPKVAIPKVKVTNTNRNVRKPRGRMGRKPRPILPVTRPIASTSTSHLEQTSTPHQIIMPSPQMPGIAYQIFLGDHSKNANNVQYTMLQPQPVFLQQTPTSVSTPSSVVISQPSMVINPPYQMRERNTILSLKIPKIAPKVVNQSYCSFCYKHFNNMQEHIKDCWLNPNSKNYKFRKIAPSTPL